jgi:hypothetical protein
LLSFAAKERLFYQWAGTIDRKPMKLGALLNRVCGIVLLLTSLAGCASIVSGRHAEVSISSNPPNAYVVIHNKRGQEVASVHTPGTVALKRKDQFIFPSRYTATIAAPGYQTAQVPIRSTVNPWVLGNIVVGGIPGLVIDNATGAAWKPRDAEILTELVPVYAAEQSTRLSSH